MNNNLFSPENIEAYLTNNLSEAEKVKFEKELSKDPLLKNEVDLQSDIIKAIQQTRKLELKRRLNSIDIPSTATYFSYRIAATVLIGLSLIGSMVYYGYDRSTLTVEQVKRSEKVIVPVVRNNTQSSSSLKDAVSSDLSVANSPIQTAPSILADKNTIVSHEPSAVFRETNINAPEIKSEFIEEEEFSIDHSVSVPKGEVIDSHEDLTSEVEVSIQNPIGENNFHYKFFDKKLFLFSDFNSQPYELIEFNKKNSKQLYLYYNNSYYQLKGNQMEITPLKAIKNQELIKQLEAVKHNN